jgi:putative oxidoreductase
MTAPNTTAPNIVAKWPTWAPYLLSVLRIVTAFLFMQFGMAKLFAFPAAIMPGEGTAPVVSLVGLASILETFGGLLLLLGLFTRPVAFIVAGEMAIAYFVGHAPQGFWPVLNQGHPAIMFCFVWLYISAAGPGPWSLDAKRGK